MLDSVHRADLLKLDWTMYFCHGEEWHCDPSGFHNRSPLFPSHLSVLHQIISCQYAITLDIARNAISMAFEIIIGLVKLTENSS